MPASSRRLKAKIVVDHIPCTPVTLSRFPSIPFSHLKQSGCFCARTIFKGVMYFITVLYFIQVLPSAFSPFLNGCVHSTTEKWQIPQIYYLFQHSFVRNSRAFATYSFFIALCFPERRTKPFLTALSDQYFTVPRTGCKCLQKPLLFRIKFLSWRSLQ